MSGLKINAQQVRTLALLGLAGLVLAVYWPGLSGGYVFDDFGNIVDNPSFAEKAIHMNFLGAVWSSLSSQLHRPISMLTFAAQVWFTGLDPWPLKFVNVLIHLFNGLLIFLLCTFVLSWLHAKRRAGREWLLAPQAIALLVAAAWLLAPIQLTAVLYVVQRMESLSALFVLLGLLAWWRGRILLVDGRRHAWAWIWGGLVGGTILATLSKETGVMLPAYAFLLEWLVLGFAGKGGTRDLRLFVVFVAVLFVPAILGLSWMLPGILSGKDYGPRDFDLPQRLWTEGRVMVDYLRWIVAPTPNALSLYHDDIPLSVGWFHPTSTILSWAFIASLVGGAIVVRRRAPVIALGVLWFFTGQMLVSTVVPLELVYEHRNYLPSLGVFLALIGGLATLRAPVDESRSRMQRVLVVAGFLGVVLLYAVFTGIRAQIWAQPYRLAYFEATTHPQSPRANYDLARLMMIGADIESPRYQLGLQLMKKTMHDPRAGIQPAQALIFMAAKHRQPVRKVWWKVLRTQIQNRPVSSEDVGALYSLINCDIQRICHYAPSDVQELKKVLLLALSRNPRRADLVTLTANFYANIAHDYDTAYALMLRATALAPNNKSYWKNLMVMQMAAGRLADATEVLSRLRELNFLGTEDSAIKALSAELAKKKQAALTVPNESPKAPRPGSER